MQKFNELIQSGKPVLVDFYAEWCSPCKLLAPVLKEVSVRVGDRAKIIRVDIDQSPEAASCYGIRSVPTLILFKNGEIKWRQSGLIAGSMLMEVLERYA